MVMFFHESGTYLGITLPLSILLVSLLRACPSETQADTTGSYQIVHEDVLRAMIFQSFGVSSMLRPWGVYVNEHSRQAVLMELAVEERHMDMNNMIILINI